MIRIADLVTRSPTLCRFAARVRQLAHVERLLHASLGDPLARHCRVADLRDGVLTVHVDSPAWSAKLRYRTPDLLAQLHRRDPGAAPRSVVIRIRPAQPVVDTPSRPAPRLSGEIARLIESIAADTDNEPLKAALLRLASRHG